MEASGPLIPPEQYKRIVEVMPILCVDVIVWMGWRKLLVKRANEPLKGEWWVPGGRILKGEKAVDAAYRKVLIETGLSLKSISFFGMYEDFYEASAHGCKCHSLSVVFEAEANPGVVSLNEESEGFMWAEELPERFKRNLLK